MAYLGNEPSLGRYSKLDDISSQFNGSTLTFNLLVSSVAAIPGTANNLLISINGILQEPTTAFTVFGSTITFTEAPSLGMSFFGIILGNVMDVGTVSDNTISNAKFSETIAVNKGGTGATTLTGLVKGNGTSAFTPAVVATDYVSPSVATSFTKPQRPSMSSEVAPVGNVVTWDLTSDQIFRVNLNANITSFILTGTLASLVGNQYQLVLRYNGGSSIVWNTNMKWTGGTAPTLTGTAGKVDIISFIVASTDGTNFYLLNTGLKQNLG